MHSAVLICAGLFAELLVSEWLIVCNFLQQGAVFGTYTP